MLCNDCKQDKPCDQRCDYCKHFVCRDCRWTHPIAECKEKARGIPHEYAHSMGVFTCACPSGTVHVYPKLSVPLNDVEKTN